MLLLLGTWIPTSESSVAMERTSDMEDTPSPPWAAEDSSPSKWVVAAAVASASADDTTTTAATTAPLGSAFVTPSRKIASTVGALSRSGLVSPSAATSTSPPKHGLSSNKNETAMKRRSPRGPPEGFVLSARVVTNATDGLSYFVDLIREDAATKMRAENTFQEDSTVPKPENQSQPDITLATETSSASPSPSLSPPFVLPFSECGAAGSATPHFFLQHSSFRHFPAGADPSTWTTVGSQPQLIVALKPLEIQVSGNDQETRLFEPGDVILLEDTAGRGHKIRSPTRDDLSILIIALPPHVSKSQHHNQNYDIFFRSVLGPFRGKAKGPCQDSSRTTSRRDILPRHHPLFLSRDFSSPSLLMAAKGRSGRPWTVGAVVRRSILTVLGSTLSSAAVLALSGKARSWVAVAFGAICAVGMGTVGAVVGGERALEHVEGWFVRRSWHRHGNEIQTDLKQNEEKIEDQA